MMETNNADDNRPETPNCQRDQDDDGVGDRDKCLEVANNDQAEKMEMVLVMHVSPFGPRWNES